MTKLEVLDQPVYGNSNIAFNGKPIFLGADFSMNRPISNTN